MSRKSSEYVARPPINRHPKVNPSKDHRIHSDVNMATLQPPTQPDWLLPNQRLTPSNCIVSFDNCFKLCVQTDGDVVLSANERMDDLSPDALMTQRMPIYPGGLIVDVVGVCL
jgi:hypothetical protein